MERRVHWAPWRIDYILGPKPDACVFCVPEHDGEDRERLILARGEASYVLMNKYPYNSGHLMVAPYRHVNAMSLLTDAEMAEIMRFLQLGERVFKEQMRAGGVNVGLNVGEAAGAGIREHLHFHLVPRWNGDSSFIAVTGETRLIPEYLLSTYDRLKPFFEQAARDES